MNVKGEGGAEPAILNPDFISDDTALVKCPCGWDTVKFKETGRLGCPECYNTFAPLLHDALKSMHKGTFHLGKQPGNPVGTSSAAAAKILSYQKELELAVQKEDYEKAAELRDIINDLKADNSKPKRKRKIKTGSDK